MQRPKEFDARVMEHLPLIRVKAKRYVKPANREDFIQDCLMAILANWQSFRDDGHYTGFTTWVSWQVRSVASNYKQKMDSFVRAKTQSDALRNTAPVGSRIGRRSGRLGGRYPMVRTSAPQEYMAAIRDAIDHIPNSRERDALFMRAAGGSLKEIGSVLGVCHQRADQLIGGARFCLDKVAA